MKKSTKILLALATLWPFVYMILFFIFVFSSVLFMPGPSGEESGPPFFFAVFFALHLLTMLWMIALTVIYMVNVFRNDRVEKDKKVLWAVVLFMGSIIAMPIYWYLYIWKESPATSLPPPPALGTAANSGLANGSPTSREQQYVPPTQPPNWR
ncbi:MAG TPA: hypothetical protein VJU86_10570 [Pyrinomonadaceae bacterium]|nr:hypothetical protein [Pyrinomonadaceae bacterium]